MMVKKHVILSVLVSYAYLILIKEHCRNYEPLYCLTAALFMLHDGEKSCDAFNALSVTFI